MNFGQNMLPAVLNDASMSISRNFSDRKQVARLFLFSPRNIINVCKRPHIYNFNMEFINDLENNIDELGNLGVSGNIVGMSFMNKYRSSLDAVTPSANGILMQTKYLSDYWTFILQIDNDQFRNQNGENVFGGPILTNRYIYSGFCTDEPRSKITGRINPKCFLRITHVTSLANENRFRPSGGTVKKMIVSSDVDFIPPVTTMQLNNNANYYISPQAVNQSCVMSETDSDVFISGNKNLASYNDKPIPSSTVFNSPKHHLQTIVNAFMSSYDERNAESVVANSMSTDRFGFGSDINVFKTNIANKLNVGYTDDLLSIDPSKLYSIAELKENYEFLREYDWIITKGIFSEMFAADGTLYTEKLKKEDKIVKNDVYDNNKYEIVDPKVKLIYNALKKWHKSHMKLYDMIIDPISSPKAIDSAGEKSFYDLYYQLKLKDLDFMKMVLDNVEKGITEEELNDKVMAQIGSNLDFYSSINRSGQALCEKYDLNYDGKENPFIR